MIQMYYQVLLITVSLLKTLHNFDTNVLVVVLRLITVTHCHCVFMINIYFDNVLNYSFFFQLSFDKYIKFRS